MKNYQKSEEMVIKDHQQSDQNVFKRGVWRGRMRIIERLAACLFATVAVRNMTIRKWQELIAARRTAGVSLVVCLAWLVSPLQVLSVQWTPSEITTTAWYDASDTSSIHDTGGLVDQWDDKSTNANNATASSTFRPTTGFTNTIGTLNALYFASDIMDTGLTQLTNASIYFVAQAVYKGISFNNCVLQSATSATGGGLYITLQNYNNHLATHGVLYTGGISASQRYLNGVAATTDHGFTPAIFSHSGTGFTTQGLTYKIGCGVLGADSRSAVNAYLGEIIICSIVHDAATRQKMEGYLAWKWGLEGKLPGDHPYKSARPVAKAGTVVVIK